MRTRLIILAIIAAALAGGLAYSQWRKPLVKVSGFVEADEIRIGSRVGGRVLHVLADEGQRVKAGDVIIELEPYDLLERLAQAKAQSTAAQAEADRIAAGFRSEEIAQAKARADQLAAKLQEDERGPRPQEIAAARAQVQVAESQVDLAQITFNQTKQLIERNAGSKEEFDRATANLHAAQASVEVAKQRLAQLEEGTRREVIAQAKASLDEAMQQLALMQAGYRTQEKEQAQATAQAAQAAVRAMEKQIEELKVRAPVDGVIEALDLRPGDLVAPGAPVLSLMDVSHLWIRAFVPENRLNLKMGQKMSVSIDSFGDKRFSGHVSFISRQGEFTPGNIQTPEDRSKQVFRVKITMDDGLDVLRPGMAGDVWLE